MFLQQAFKPGNKFWKYLAGSLIVFAASIIGQLPFTIAIAAKALSKGGAIPTTQTEMLRFMDLNLTFFLLLLSFAVAMLGLYLIIKPLHNQKFKEIVTSRPKVDWGRVFFSFAIWAVFSTGTILLTYFTEPESFVLQFNPTKFLLLCLIALPLVPIQTSVEELLFRGYLMQGFGLLAKNRWFPLVLTSVIFGGMHIFNPEIDKMGIIIILSYIGTGFCLGIMTLMDEGTELALGFHAANNLTAALLITADWTAFQTHSIFKDVSEPSAGVDVLLPVIIIYPILLYIFAKKYKWFGWKEKLTGTITPIEQPNPIPYNHE